MRVRPELGRLFLLGAVALGSAVAWSVGCSDYVPPDVPSYGPPNALSGKSPGAPTGDAGGVTPPQGDGGTAPTGDGGVTAAAVLCVTNGGTLVDAGACAVSWKNQIYPAMQPTGAYACSQVAGCHGTATNKPYLAGDEHAFYTTLANYLFTGATQPYFNPCSTDPAQLTFECNLLPAGACGGLSMPLGAPIGDAGMIDTWVRCGAPEN